MLPLDTALALVSFAFATSITPGPNNIMLTASGVNFGFARTIPHMLGIGAGFMALLVAVGLGIGAIFAAAPELQTILKVVGAAYILWLAWRVANAGPVGEAADQRSRPMTFWEAAAFQWVNPKAWVMAVTAMAVYTNPERPFLSVLIVVFAFTLVNLPSVSCWAGFGMALRGFLADPVRLKWFNIAMGVLLAVTLWPMLK